MHDGGERYVAADQYRTDDALIEQHVAQPRERSMDE
jgi:hypothetical protein